MGEQLKLSSDTIEVTTEAGQSFIIRSPLEFLKELEQLHDNTVGKGQDYYVYWQAIAALVAERNPGVLISLDEADNLAVEVGIIGSKKKQMQAERIRNAQNSAFSMAGTASTSPKSN